MPDLGDDKIQFTAANMTFSSPKEVSLLLDDVGAGFDVVSLLLFLFVISSSLPLVAFV